MSRLLDMLAGVTGVVFDYAGSAAPNGWLLCYGQAVSRTDYANLFAVIGTTYGAGDGSTTFNVPDCRGRVHAGKDDMGGTAAGRLNVTTSGTTTAGSAVVTGISSTSPLTVGMSAIGPTLPAGVTISSIDSATQVTLSTGTGVTAGTVSLRFGIVDGATLGAAGGKHTHTITSAEMPAHTHANSLTDPGHTHTTNVRLASSTTGGQYPYRGSADNDTYAVASQSGTTGITITNASQGGGQAASVTQPTLVLNKIIKT